MQNILRKIRLFCLMFGATVSWFGCQIHDDTTQARQKPEPLVPSDLNSIPIAKIALKGTGEVCTGILVEKNLVLTAAHCFFSGALTKKDNPPHTVSLQRNNGEWSAPIEAEASGEANYATHDFEDIAWIRLKKNMDDVYLPAIGIRQIDTNQLKANTSCMAYGQVSGKWFSRGIITLDPVQTGLTPDLLKWQLPTAQDPKMAGGDSGGPLLLKQNDTWLLIGILQGEKHYATAPSTDFTAVQPFLPALAAAAGKALSTTVVK